MATKAQAKAAIDAAVVSAKAEIDNTQPSGVNIIDGALTFNPTRCTFFLNAGGTLTAAQTLRDSLITAFAAASRTYNLNQVLGRRLNDPAPYIRLQTSFADYEINNF